MYKPIRTLTVAAALCAAGTSLATAQSVKRYPIPHSHFPISAAVEVPAGKSLVFLSGMGGPKDASAQGSATETQTVGALQRIQKQLQSMGMSLKDVVKMHAYLVADPKTGKMDFAGFMKGYTQFFGTSQQPNLPARSAFQVAGLAGPGMLVEIEVTAVRP